MPGDKTNRKWIRQNRGRFIRVDPLFIFFLILGWGLIFFITDLGLKRGELQWVPHRLSSRVSANYSQDAAESPRLARVDPKIIEAVRQDRLPEITPSPPATPVTQATVTPTTELTPTTPPALVLSIGGPYLGDEGHPVKVEVKSNSSFLNFLPGSITYRWDLNNDGLYEEDRGASTTVVFVDEGDYQIGVQATDLLGRVYTDQTIVQISNVPPVVAIPAGDLVADEGDEITFLATAEDPGHDVLMYEWDFGDGSVVETNTLTPRHTYRNDGSYRVRLRVSDNDGGAAETWVMAHIRNRAPLVEIGPDQVVDEGSPVTLTGSATDPGQDDRLVYLWDLDYDGKNFTPDAEGPTVTKVYSNGPANVTAALLVYDDSGAETIKQLNVAVNNVPPAIASVSHNSPINEGDTLRLSVEASDPGDDALLFAYDWDNDGTFETAGSTGVVSRLWPNDGEYSVPVRVRDADGAEVFTTTIVSAINLPPVAIATGPNGPRFEGATVSFDALDSSDPGLNDRLSYRWDFGDGATATDMTASHVYADNGVYSATLTIEDDSGAVGVTAIPVTILNANPKVDAGPDIIVNERRDNGDITVPFNATAQDAGPADTLTYAWDVDNDGIFESTEPSFQHIFKNPDGPKEFPVTVRVRDDDYQDPPAGGNEVGQATDTLIVRVKNVAPEAQILGSYTAFEMDLVTLRGTATDHPADILTYAWDLDDDPLTFEASGPEVSHTWDQAGSYTVWLRVTDDDGGEHKVSTQVTINNALPVAEANGPYTTEVNQPVTLSSAGSSDPTGDPLTFTWDFGDGNSATTTFETVEHTYLDDGLYNVSLAVNDGRGGTVTATTSVTVTNLSPTAAANAAPTAAPEGSPITFDASGSWDPGQLDTLSYTWDFGDASGGSGITTTHVFADNGVYTATVTVTDDAQASDTATVAVSISNAPPTAEAGTDRSVNEAETFNLTGSATDPGRDDTLTFAWDFNYDGTTFSPDASGRTISHKYADGPAEYTVALQVTDDDGAASPIDTLQVIVNNLAPTASAGGPYTGIETRPVDLSATASDVPGDTLSYAWDLDDNPLTFEASGQQVTHTWDRAGSYTARLRVTDDDGDETIVSAGVTISNAPPTAQANGPYTTEVNQPVTLSSADSSDPTGDPLTFTWDFGDGNSTTTTSQTVEHTYLDDGLYNVSLTVDDGRGGTDTSTTSVTVTNLPPIAAANAAPTAAPEGSPITFDASGSWDPGQLDTLSYTWDFGDGNTATGPTAQHAYADNGDYTATVTVTDDAGASDTATVAVSISNAPPTAEAGADRSVNEAETFSLTGSASDPGRDDTLTFAWDFDYDGATFSPDASGQTVQFAYPDGPAEYTVALQVTDDDGAASPIDTLQVTVNNLAPTASAGGPYTAVEGEPVTLTGSGSDVPADSLSFNWDLNGDGNFETNGQTVSYTWPVAGTYTIVLQVDDGDGGVTTAGATAEISPQPAG